ncbi:MAG TPA: hypothetical protein VFD38_07455 [Myxococcaceae bacterium]|nr:hypothetical protein [Myxococcaceae bacterium]
MRRLVLAALAVLAAGGAFWLRERSRTSSFAPYSDAQLDTLAAGYRAVMRTPPGPGDAALDAELSLGMLEAEQRRRIRLRGLAILSVLAAGGVLLPGRRRARSDRGEEARLRDALGDPALVLEGERHKAARLLGVTPDASPEVIEAALAAQLATHDPGKLEGLAPDLRRVVLDRREALQRARDLLLGGGKAPIGTASQQ